MKKKKVLQKNLIYAALASAMLLCNACGKENTAPEDATEKNMPNTTDTTDTADSNAADSLENDSNNTADSTADTTDNNADNTADSDTGAEEKNSARISIAFQAKRNDVAEDNNIIYSSLVNYPVVTIEGNESAAEKINADIQTRINAFLADTTTLDMAKEGYQYTLTEDSEYAFLGYSSDLDFIVTRSDSNVISFTATYYAFSGGAHGNYTVIGINYDTQTGELITFSQLSENPDAFRADTLAFNQELAASESYQDMLFPSASEDLESVLYADEKWYLSTSGLVFISDPYLLGPYAAGMIEFAIPYDTLKEMGLKEEYQYEGNLTVKLANGESHTIDINGDGTDDTIAFHTTYEEAENGTSDFTARLILNDIDVTEGYNDELSQLLTDDPWAECALYDMDPADDTIEIVFSSTQLNETTGETETVSSYFFRYEKDGSVTYLGMARGAVTDPTADMSTLTL